VSELYTNIATSTPETVTVRGKDLINDLVGEHSFTDMIYFSITDRFPTAGQRRVFDACLVMLMEHGFTPSALVARVLADALPSEVQVAMGAGLMTIGSIFAGSMEGCAALLAAGVDALDADAYCARIVADFAARKQAVPGFGHRFHKPDDPRTPRLLAIAEEEGLSTRYVALLRRLAIAVDAQAGRHLTLNATGAIGALLLEIGLPVTICRAVAVVSRSGGLIAHIVEEQATHSARTIAKLTNENIPYRAPSGGGET
jgi:citrate synthase